MKRKAIEKIPYLTGKKCQKRSKKFVAAVAIKIVEHEKHLFLEVYENKKAELRVPKYRFVYTKKDWSYYHPESGTWSAGKIVDDYHRIRWTDPVGSNEKDTFIAEEDVEKIKTFSGTSVYNASCWWEYLTGLEDTIRHERWKRKTHKRKERLEDRCSNVPAIPEGFENWYKDVLFHNVNFIYYKRKGRFATFHCSHCGGSYTYATRHLDTFEGQFEHVVDIPRAGSKARCELCDAEAMYKTAGTMKTVYGQERVCYVGQPYKEKGAIIRYFAIEKYFAIGRPEQYSCTEIARNYFEEGKKIITDFHLYNGWTGKSDWYDHNVGGMGAQIAQKEAAVYAGTYDDLKGTILQYSGLQEYMEDYDTVSLVTYIERYREYPFMEILAKLKMHRLVNQIMEYSGPRLIKDKYATNPEDLLGIKKERMKLLINHHGDTDLLEIFQHERELGVKWSEEQCMNLRKICINWGHWGQLKVALRYMSIQQLLNRVQKYAGVTFEEAAGCAVGQLNHAAVTYLDYLQMRAVLEYDLTNSIIQYPRDIEAAHREMVLEVNKDEVDKRLMEVKIKYPNIRSNYRVLRNRYFYEDEKMVIRPARSAEEIVMEGRLLHHCVGGDNYLRKHDKGETTILMLRFKNCQDNPYITVEIKETTIQQWYGEHDKKTDQKEMQKWLDAYVTRLKCQAKEGNGATGQQADQRILMYA